MSSTVARRSPPAAHSNASSSERGGGSPTGDAASLDLAAALFGRDLPCEHGFEPLAVEGRLPRSLRGTLYRNGPGLFSLFGSACGHPFEADGALTAVRLGDGRAFGATRVIDSAGLREERAAGRRLYGWSQPWLRRLRNTWRGRFKNTANTSVLAWQGRLFALMEAGRPTEIDPGELQTIGETDLDGVVVSAFSAHPHRLESRAAAFNFGVAYGRATTLHLYRLPDAGPAAHLGALGLDGAPLLHDFVVTARHLIFFVPPVRVNVPRMLLQVGNFTSMFDWRPGLGTEVVCVPIDRPAEPVRFTVDAFFQWHFGNAYEDGDEVVVDFVGYPDFACFQEIGRGDLGRPGPGAASARLCRARIDVVGRRMRTEPLADQPCEFPRVHPAREGLPHRYVWVARADLRGIARVDTSTGHALEHRMGAGQAASEPVFVPRPGSTGTDELDGHVLALCYDGVRDRSFLAVYDARDLERGPLARAWFDHHIPITFHGAWVPASSTG